MVAHTLRILFLFAFIIIAGLSFGQYGCAPVPEGTLENSSIKGQHGAYITQKRVIPYPHIREADVMWARRVWRVIDLRQKLNQPLYYPTTPTQVRSSLFSTITCALNNGTLHAYGTGVLGDDDSFTQELTLAEINDILIDTTEQWMEDPDNGVSKPVYIPRPTESAHVKQYLVKEEWFFDKQRSVMDVRIIGICPIKEEYTEFGEFKGHKRLFWIYFPELRYTLRQSMMFHRANDAGPLTYEDMFMKRMFNSYIVKSSNVHDRYINEYKIGEDAILEGELKHEEIFNFEQDLWHY